MTSKRARAHVKARKNEKYHTSNPHSLMDFPFEIFTEILSNVSPADMLSLAHTCKPLRKTLMNRSTENMWRRAEENVPGLPPYPWCDLSRPQYAALIFMTNCTTCGEHTSGDADPFLLVRLCPDCRETKLVAVDDPNYCPSRIYELVSKTNLFKFYQSGARRRLPASGNPIYGLTSEVEEIRRKFKLFSTTGSPVDFQHWEQAIAKEVTMRHKFGKKLQTYFTSVAAVHSAKIKSTMEQRVTQIKGRLRALGWTDRDFAFVHPERLQWQGLVEVPHPLTEGRWNWILPRLTPLLEANRARLQEADRQECKNKLQVNLHQCLTVFKLDTHSLRGIVEDLGFGELLTVAPSPTGPIAAQVAGFLDRYPFPDTPTAMTWACLREVQEKVTTLDELLDLVLANWEEIRTHVQSWIREAEAQLVKEIFVERVSEWTKDPCVGDQYVNNTKSSLMDWDLSPNTRFLLRADTVFAHLDEDEDPERLETFHYYPEFLQSRGDHNHHGQPPSRCATGYYRHVEAERVATALLKTLEMPDISYLELAVIGKQFLCGRCSSHDLMDWKEIMQHYLDELHIWDLMRTMEPRFKTRHPIYIDNAHDLGCLTDQDDHEAPLVRLLTEDEVTKHIKMSLVDDSQATYCAPCRNYGRMYVLRGWRWSIHLWNTHRTYDWPIEHKVHYFFVKDESTFLEIGGAWRDSWDAHYDEHKSVLDELEWDRDCDSVV